jgi:hypothetical protein
MDTSSFTCSRERSVHNTRHATLRVADVLLTSLLLRLLGVWRASKIRPFLSFKRGPLFCFGFIGRDRAKPRLTQFNSHFVSPFVSTDIAGNICVPVSQMLNLRNALKIFQTIIGLNAVNVMNLLGRIKTFHPTFSNDTVHKKFTAHAKIPPIVFGWRVGAMLSENFPAARDGVKVVKGAVFHALYCKANHAVSSVITNMITLSAFRRNVKRV